MVRQVEQAGDLTAVHVDLELFNVDEGHVSTEGKAVVLLPDPTAAAIAAAPETLAGHYGPPGPQRAAPSAGDASDEAVPAAIRRCIGTELERRVSCDRVEPGRLRLFAAAVMDMPAHHYDPAAARASVYGEVVAPPLFPLHAIAPAPHECELDTDPHALGREGVAEVGRGLARRFGLPPHGLLNGGTSVRVHALARVGDTVRATSRLTDARHHVGHSGVGMLILQTENRYETTAGRLLLSERQTILQRLTAPP
jgi:acyl dehydratase